MDDSPLPHCGPISYPGLKVSRTSEGIIAQQIPKFVQSLKPDPWVADWIWLDPKEFPDFQQSAVSWKFMAAGSFAVGLFRKKLTINIAPQRVIAWISADVKYRLYVNGQMVGRGPSQVGGDIDFDQAPSWWFYDHYDLSSYFRQGVNIITAEVLHHLDVGSDLSVGHSGFLFEAQIEGNKNDKNENLVIKSDTSWRAILGEAFLIKTMYDAAYEPDHWHEQDFDDTQWSPAHVVSSVKDGPWHLLPCGIPHLMEYRYDADSVDLVTPDTNKQVQNVNNLLHYNKDSKTIISPGDPVKIILEFDREIAGYLQFAINAPKGVILNFGFIEQVKEDFNDLYITREGFQTFELFRLRPCRCLRLTVDFGSAKNGQSPLEIHYIGINFVSYPVQYSGNFTCSDPVLTEIWQAGRWTNQLCMQTYYLDSPVHQEPLGDHGDYMIEALISYYTFGDYLLARHDIVKTIHMLKQRHCRMFHTSYSLLWLQMVMDYHLYSGDESILHEALPVIHELLERFHSYLGISGILTEAPNYMFFDWITVDGFNLHHPPCVIGQAYLSAYYYQALQNGARVCEVCNDPNSAKKYRDWATAIAQAFQRELWIEEQQMFCDGRAGRTHVSPYNYLPADSNKIYFSRHTNALAVLFDLVPLSNAKKLMERIMQNNSLPMVQPYFMHFILNALTHVDLFDTHGLTEIRKWKRLLDEHPTSFKESWNFGDYSHAWSCTPTYQLSARVLGIIPTLPGFAKIRIDPNLGDLMWAKGVIPTPYGLINVVWKKQNNKLDVHLNIPLQIVVENPPYPFFNRWVFVVGTAFNSKAGAIIRLNGSDIIYIDQLSSWDGTNYNNGDQIAMTGIIRCKKYIPDPINERGEICQGAEGTQLVMEMATWQRIESLYVQPTERISQKNTEKNAEKKN